MTPESLNEQDRRVYELAVKSIPLAEIAVRLGLPVGQAEERIQQLCSRLGVADRGALRAGAPPDESLPSDPEATEAATAVLPVSVGRSITRRALVLGAGAAALVAAAGGVGAWALLRRKDEGATAVPTEAAPSSASPLLEGLERVSFADAWEVAHFDKGALIDWPHGLFLMAPIGGEVQGFRLRDEPEAFEYRLWASGRFIEATAQRDQWPPMQVLMDVLNPETAWRWPYDKYRLVGGYGPLPEAYLLFESMTDANKGTGQITAVLVPRPGAEPESAFSVRLPPTGWSPRVVHIPSANAVAVAAVSNQLHITMFSEPSGAIIAEHRDLAAAQGPNETLAVTTFEEKQASGKPGTLLLGWRRSDQQTGAVLEEKAVFFQSNSFIAARPFETRDAYSWSPDGELYVRELALSSTYLEGGDGFREYWPAVEVVEALTRRVLRRIRSAVAYFGDFSTSRRWNGDRSFLAMVRAANTSDGYDVGVINNLTPSGSWLVYANHEFPADPGLAKTWYQSPWVQGAFPCPDDKDLVALGRFAVMDVRSRTVVRANVRNEAGPAHLDPWAAGRGFLAFAFPHGGHGGASPPVLLQPKWESGDAPVETPLRFKVASDRIYPPPLPRGEVESPTVSGTRSAESDRLNLRDQPSLTGKVIAVLENGSSLTLASSPDPARKPGRQSVEQAADGTWLYVRTPGTLEGWVNSAYVAWA